MSLSFFGKKSIVGVDLGHSSIRIVEIERSSTGWVLGKAAESPMPEDSVRDGVIIDPESVGNVIRSTMFRCHMGASAAHIAVAGASVIVRTVRIPQMSEASLRKSIKIEAGRYVPSSVEDSYIEFEIIGKTDDHQMDVLIVAAPKEVVESRMAAVKHAGLTVESVDVEVFASYRSLVEADQGGGWNDKTLAMVDVGSSCTTVSVVQQGTFTMTRSISQGGQLLTDALKNYFRMSDAEAENGKSQLDISMLVDESTPKENPPLRVVQPHIDDLIREIRRSLNYFQSQQTEGDQNKSVEAILLTGGGAKLPGLAEYMAHKLGIPTIAAGVFDNPRFTFSGNDDWGTGAELSIATGLAMRSYLKAEKAKVA